MSKRLFLLPCILRSLVVAICVGGCFPCLLHSAPARPNILLILADDLGWSDTTLFGTTKFYETPNVERLARRGMTFTRAYAASPLCSPTRASILSGQNPARVGITAPVCHLKTERLKAEVRPKAPANAKALICDSATRFDTDHFTLAEALKLAGYATGHFGKWHLGPEPWSPLQQGFDVDVPHWPGPGPAGSFVAPWKFPDFKERTPSEHIEDRMADEAVAFIEKHKDGPFFLNYWQFSVHAPFNAKEAYIERHRKRVDPKDAQRSPTYAAMVQSLDDAIGRMLDALERLGIADNTLIIFYSDNGGNMYNEVDGTTPTSNRPLRGGKATMWEGGIRVPAIFSWPGRIAAGARNDSRIQSTDLYPTLLELLGLKPRPGQIFDGVSIAPALEGRAFDRGPMFTFFPHQTKVPDFLPPAVSVHRGDWKLIRLFHQGENGAHAYELFNLRNDQGERNNLAAANPKLVAELDGLIGGFLRDTQAVVPRTNPDYDPTRAKPVVPGVAPIRNVTLTKESGALRVVATGGDPHFQLTPDKPIPAGKAVFVLRMKTESKGGAQFFWQEQGARPAFHRSRRIDFQPIPDNQPHDYRIKFEAKRPIQTIRLDPFPGKGTAVIDAVWIESNSGEKLQDWKF